MGKLYIVRHGETVWNREGRIQGHTDVGLSERGLEQARLLAQRLKSVPLDAAYASDLCRASDTAAAILEGRDVPLYPTPRLREYHKGAFEGLTEAELRARYPAEYPGYIAKDLDYAPEGGESTRGVSARMTAAVNEIKERHLGDNVLVVGHGGSLRAAMMVLLGNVHGRQLALRVWQLYPDHRRHLPRQRRATPVQRRFPPELIGLECGLPPCRRE